MSDNRSYRIRTKVNSMDSSDRYLNVKLDSDFDILEVLSLKIKTENFYKIHTSDYGCIVGRVLANGGVGVPNAKISVFIGLTDEDSEDPIISELYPYYNVFARSSDKRYNLLPEDKMNDCHNPVGTFPNKRLVLDDDNMIEIFDKYYKFTTRTNDAGDYMIFGAPTGDTNVHVDLDLSDIGRLSQKPRDMIYKGYSINMFENANKFKTDDNLDNLVQLISQDNTVYVYPFWGNSEENVCKITRNDVTIQYKFEPTCIFLGSVVTDANDQGINKNCIPTDRMGKMDKLTTGIGTIEMIRKTVFGGVEEKQIQGKELIDGNGTWCYQIPMNLDYFVTDEYGNDVPSNDPEKGIPTRTRVRFRISLDDDSNEYVNHRLAKVLVPNNPKSNDDLKKCYRFGTYTNDDEYGTKDFRDLFANNIYTVKQYIPRIQKGNHQDNLNFSGIKNINVNNGKNPIPYNNMRVNLTFMFRLQCALLKASIRNIQFINGFVHATEDVSSSDDMRRQCTVLGDGICPDLKNWYFAPGCRDDVMDKTNPKTDATDTARYNEADTSSIEFSNNETMAGDTVTVSPNSTTDPTNTYYCITNKTFFLMQCVEINLAMEYNVIQFDFYNDWINGMIYVPRWIVNVRKKRSYLFGSVRETLQTYACTDDSFKLMRRYTQQCALWYSRQGNLYSKPPVNVNTGIVKQGVGCTERTLTITFTVANGLRFLWRHWYDSGSNYSFRLSALGYAVRRYLLGWYKTFSVTFPLQKCHTGSGRKSVFIFGNNGGIVHGEKALSGMNAYYFKPCEFTNNGKRVNLFATDIVLLGSLDEYNENGVPVVMSEMVTSTYNMPPNLAATNMDKQGFMYSMGSQKGTICKQEGGMLTYSSMEIQDDTFSNYKEWIKDTDYSESNIDDALEYPITETSGIDWGYYGPNQGGNLTQYVAGSTFSAYHPGGHFLGISCNNAQTNIKTCVNLSRICEYGSIMSQRQVFARSELNTPEGGENVKLEYDAIIPNGVISRYELTDTNFRRMFATMNSNGLKTVHDEDNYFMKYTFKYYHPTAYGGELEDYLKGFNPTYSDKNNPYFWWNWDNGIDGNGIIKHAYRRAIDFKSDDYLYFRLGIDTEGKTSSEIKNMVDKKYLITEEGYAALPQYENSYYFYFGLNDGNTAIDRFFKDFYATCSTIEEEGNFISIEIDNGTNDNNGIKKYKALITLLNLEAPYTIKLYKGAGYNTVCYFKNSDNNSFDIEYSNTTSNSTSYKHFYDNFSLNGLTSGTYKIEVITDDYGTNYATFNVVEIADDEIAAIEVTGKNHKNETYTEDINAAYTSSQVLTNNDFGAIVVYNIEDTYLISNSIKALIVVNDEKFMYKNIGASSYTEETIKDAAYAEGLNLNNLKCYQYYKGSGEDNYGFSSDYQNNFDITTDLGILDGTHFVAFPAWQGNSSYTVYAVYKVGGKLKVVAVGNIYITMPVQPSIGIYSSALNTNRNPELATNGWYNGFLTNTKYSELQKWCFKKGLFARNSMYELSLTNKVTVLPGSVNFTTSCSNENSSISVGRFEDNTSANCAILSVDRGPYSGEGYSNLISYHFPSHYFSGGTITAYGYSEPYDLYGYKSNAIYHSLSTSNIPAAMPSITSLSKTVQLPTIYRPFFINGIKLINEHLGHNYYVGVVVNPVTYNNKVNKFSMNSYLWTEFIEDYNGYSYNYKTKFDTLINNYGKTNESLNIEYEELNPTKDENVLTREKEISAAFPSNVTDSSFEYSDSVKFFYAAPKNTTELSYKDSNNNTNYFSDGSSTTSISGGTYYLYLKNVSTENDAVTFNFTGKTGVKYSCSSIGRFNCTDLLRGSMALIKKGCIDANGVSSGTTVSIYSNSSYYKNDNKYRHVIIPVNSGDILYIKSNIEYKFLSVNYTNSLKQVQTVYTKPEGGVVDTNSVTFDHSGHAIIWWDKSSVDLAKDTLDIKITYKNSSVFEMYKGDDTKNTDNNEKEFTVYVKSAKFASLSSVEINGSTFMKASGAADFMCEKTGNEACNTISYLNYLYNKSLNNQRGIYIDGWNGIFGDRVYKLIDVSSNLSKSNITTESSHVSATHKKWGAFKRIIDGTSTNIGIRIKHDVIAVCDKWTSYTSGYNSDPNFMWKYFAPEMDTLEIVKYYPMGITI